MKESLIIRNFGPIKDIELEDISPVLIFIGESGSGKSTIMKVLVLFRWIFKKMNMRSYLHSAGISKSPFRFQFKQYIRNSGFEGYISKDTYILYKRDGYQISYENRKLNTDLALIDDKDLSLDKLSFISDKRNMIPDLLAKRLKESSANFYLMETYSDFLEASKVLDSISIPYFDVKLIKKKNTADLQYFVENKSENSRYSVHFEDSSSGMQNTIPMEYLIEYFTHHYNILDSFNKSLLSYAIATDNLMNFKPTQNVGDIRNRNICMHIEEPELSLYPSMQISFMERLLESCYSNSNDINYFVCITTHSPYIVNYMNLALKKKYISFSDLDVYFVHDGGIETLKREKEGIIDTRYLSEPIAEIYTEFNELG